MRCKKCGNKINKKSKFCNACGEPIDANQVHEDRHFYDGNVHKCPNCGEILKSFESICPSCGYELRGSRGSKVVDEFARQMQELELSKPQKGLFANLLNKNTNENVSKEQAVINLIKNFNVPNTKEDIFEFMILACSNINVEIATSKNYKQAKANDKASFDKLKEKNDAWITKAEQIYQKAKLSFGEDSDFNRIDKIYKEKMDAIAAIERKRKLTKYIIISIVIAFFLAIYIIDLLTEGSLRG